MGKIKDGEIQAEDGYVSESEAEDELDLDRLRRDLSGKPPTLFHPAYASTLTPDELDEALGAAMQLSEAEVLAMQLLEIRHQLAGLEATIQRDLNTLQSDYGAALEDAHAGLKAIIKHYC